MSVHTFRKTWLISLPIYRVSAEAEFPDILGLNSEALYYLQAGWRASDESCYRNQYRMGTTKPWQVLAWVAVRYGYLRIYLNALNLNTNELTLAWSIISSWDQQCEDKKLAQQTASRHPLGILTWYLGDGEKHPSVFRIAIGDTDEILIKQLVPQILKAAYQTSYGRLLDLLESEKWQTLKRLRPRRNPVYAVILDHTFWLSYSERAQQ
ncbi:MAG: hypothetical protein LM573_09060, partial [Thermofilum sp.]|nr:hypothetical protein [Thermofilum sp.]